MYRYVTCHLQWSVYWERSLHQVVLLKVWGRPPKPLVDFSSAMEKSIKVSSHYLTELHPLTNSTCDWTRLPEKLMRFGGWPDMERPPVHLCWYYQLKAASCIMYHYHVTLPLMIELALFDWAQMRQHPWIHLSYQAYHLTPWQSV